MRRVGLTTSLYWFAVGLKWVSIVVLVMFGLATLLQPSDWQEPWRTVLYWFDDWEDLAFPLLPAAIGVCEIIARGIGPPWVWKVVESVVDELRNHAFTRKTQRQPIHEHRVTIFKRVRWKMKIRLDRSTQGGLRVWWPWSGWLVPKVRSGHTTQRSRTVFLAPDDADHAEGVVGKVWATQGMLSKDDLPPIDGFSSGEQIREYAENSWVTEKWVRQRLDKCARCVCGIPLEVRGKTWGVIVLDSREPGGIRSSPTVQQQFRIAALVLGELLTRAK